MKLRSRGWLVAGVLSATLCLAGIAVGTMAWARGRYPAAPVAVTIHAAPIVAFDNRDPTRTRFGALAFRGGLELTSQDPNFGGISAIHVDADGKRFLALSDRGAWLRGHIVYRDGRPVDIAEAEMAPMLAWDGKPLGKHGWYDSESLTEDRAGHAYVGIERVQRIVRFDLKKGLRARGQPIPVPPAFKTLTPNKSLECLAASPPSSPLAGALIVVTEHSLDAAGRHRGFLLKGRDFKTFSVTRSDDFDISDCAIVPPGDLLLLERRFSIARGVAMRIRSIPLATIKPGAQVNGKTLIEADLAYQIDNMEGIGVSRDAQGDTILTLVSDDNFSPIQRTLLLQFELVQ